MSRWPRDECPPPQDDWQQPSLSLTGERADDCAVDPTQKAGAAAWDARSIRPLCPAPPVGRELSAVKLVFVVDTGANMGRRAAGLQTYLDTVRLVLDRVLSPDSPVWGGGGAAPVPPRYAQLLLLDGGMCADVATLPRNPDPDAATTTTSSSSSPDAATAAARHSRTLADLAGRCLLHRSPYFPANHPPAVAENRRAFLSDLSRLRACGDSHLLDAVAAAVHLVSGPCPSDDPGQPTPPFADSYPAGYVACRDPANTMAQAVVTVVTDTTAQLDRRTAPSIPSLYTLGQRGERGAQGPRPFDDCVHWKQVVNVLALDGDHERPLDTAFGTAFAANARLLASPLGRLAARSGGRVAFVGCGSAASPPPPPRANGGGGAAAAGPAAGGSGGGGGATPASIVGVAAELLTRVTVRCARPFFTAALRFEGDGSGSGAELGTILLEKPAGYGDKAVPVAASQGGDGVRVLPSAKDLRVLGVSLLADDAAAAAAEAECGNAFRSEMLKRRPQPPLPPPPPPLVLPPLPADGADAEATAAAAAVPAVPPPPQAAPTPPVLVPGRFWPLPVWPLRTFGEAAAEQPSLTLLRRATAADEEGRRVLRTLDSFPNDAYVAEEADCAGWAVKRVVAPPKGGAAGAGAGSVPPFAQLYDSLVPPSAAAGGGTSGGGGDAAAAKEEGEEEEAEDAGERQAMYLLCLTEDVERRVCGAVLREGASLVFRLFPPGAAAGGAESGRALRAFFDGLPSGCAAAALALVPEALGAPRTSAWAQQKLTATCAPDLLGGGGGSGGEPADVVALRRLADGVARCAGAALNAGLAAAARRGTTLATAAAAAAAAAGGGGGGVRHAETLQALLGAVAEQVGEGGCGEDGDGASWCASVQGAAAAASSPQQRGASTSLEEKLGALKRRRVRTDERAVRARVEGCVKKLHAIVSAGEGGFAGVADAAVGGGGRSRHSGDAVFEQYVKRYRQEFADRVAAGDRAAALGTSAAVHASVVERLHHVDAAHPAHSRPLRAMTDIALPPRAQALAPEGLRDPAPHKKPACMALSADTVDRAKYRSTKSSARDRSAGAAAAAAAALKSLAAAVDGGGGGSGASVSSGASDAAGRRAESVDSVATSNAPSDVEFVDLTEDA